MDAITDLRHLTDTLDSLTSEQLAARLEQLEQEAQTVRVLLRAARTRERYRRRRGISPEEVRSAS